MASAHRVLWFPPGRPVEGNTVYVRQGVCPVPSRWVLDELARELAAERELDAARAVLLALPVGDVDEGYGDWP